MELHVYYLLVQVRKIEQLHSMVLSEEYQIDRIKASIHTYICVSMGMDLSWRKTRFFLGFPYNSKTIYVALRATEGVL